MNVAQYIRSIDPPFTLSKKQTPLYPALLGNPIPCPSVKPRWHPFAHRPDPCWEITRYDERLWHDYAKGGYRES